MRKDTMKLACCCCNKEQLVSQFNKCDECERGCCDDCYYECTNCGTGRCEYCSISCSGCGTFVNCCSSQEVPLKEAGGVCFECHVQICPDCLKILTKEQIDKFKGTGYEKEVIEEGAPSTGSTLETIIFCKECYKKK